MIQVMVASHTLHCPILPQSMQPVAMSFAQQLLPRQAPLRHPVSASHEYPSWRGRGGRVVAVAVAVVVVGTHATLVPSFRVGAVQGAGVGTGVGGAGVGFPSQRNPLLMPLHEPTRVWVLGHWMFEHALPAPRYASIMGSMPLCQCQFQY